MTVQSLYTAATGMEALETKLDVIANNMANINTTGFKKDRANFEDVFYRQYRLPGAEDADGNRTSTGIEVGLGTRVSSTQSNFKQGAFETTNNHARLCHRRRRILPGAKSRTADFYYTRAGNFGLNANGQIVLGSANNGYLLEPSITIPPEATGIVVSADGQVQYSTQNSTESADARAVAAGEVRQSGRAAEARRQPVSEDRCVGRRNSRQPGQAGLRQHSARIFGSVERRAGERTDRS